MKFGAANYLEGTAATLEKVRADIANIKKAAAILAETIRAGKSIFSFGASHSFMMTEEIVYRSGGLMLVNPIQPQGMNLAVRPLTLTSEMERLPGLGSLLLQQSPARSGDALILTSTSGRNTVIVDMALEAQKIGLRVIALTALDYTKNISSRHPSGKKLIDLCEVVVDNGAPYGDAVGEIENFPQKVGAVSSVGGCAAVNAIIAETVQLLVAAGTVPPVFMSANLDNSDEHNSTMLAANKERIHYL